ncbi:MAG: type II toxin-antitoxin system VapC family toxin [Thaumarchaeota archaeon]|nr:type II toxin-antitoxin system VapC family toxin [Nitrososphaerota archaeon]
MTCLDSSFLIELLRGSEPARRKYQELKSNIGNDRLCITTINAYELLKGAKLTSNPGVNLQLVRDLLGALNILQLDAESVEAASELYSKLRNKGKLIGEFDILIASICIANGERLLTRDEDFASIPKLECMRF